MYPREEGCYEHLVGSRDTAKHPKMYRTVSHKKNGPTMSVVQKLRNPTLEKVGTLNLEFWKGGMDGDENFHSLLHQWEIWEKISHRGESVGKKEEQVADEILGNITSLAKWVHWGEAMSRSCSYLKCNDSMTVLRKRVPRKIDRYEWGGKAWSRPVQLGMSKTSEHWGHIPIRSRKTCTRSEIFICKLAITWSQNHTTVNRKVLLKEEEKVGGGVRRDGRKEKKERGKQRKTEEKRYGRGIKDKTREKKRR